MEGGFRGWRRRFTILAKLLVRTVKGLGDNFRLLGRRWTGGKALRQTNINGYQMLIPVDEDIGRQIYYSGEYEKNESTFVKELLRETDVCFDVGANVGYYTLLMAAQARKGMVHSFEPIPFNYHLLCSSVLLNGFENVVPNCCALGNREGECEFAVAKDSGLSSFVDTGRNPVTATRRVRVTTLDRYCAQQRVERVDFLKIDVEGAEGLVLEGSRHILRDPNSRPRAILLELFQPNLAKYGTQAEQLMGLLQAQGYRAFNYMHGRTVPVGKVDTGVHHNVFFLPA